MASIDVGRTAVLAMDCQRMIVDGYAPDPAGYLNRAAALLAKARAARLRVIYVRVGFRPGHPEVSDNNSIFSGVRAGKLFLRGGDAFEIPAEIGPQEGEVVVEKHRVSSFEGTDLAMILGAAKIDTLAMFGIATSGCVLSTVRRAADLDYRLIVLEDLCADKDEEVHRVLTRKVFPGQATVISAGDFIGQLT